MGQRLAAFQQAFWKFLRPHTIRGTILGSVSVTTRVLLECREAGSALLHCLLMRTTGAWTAAVPLHSPVRASRLQLPAEAMH